MDLSELPQLERLDRLPAITEPLGPGEIHVWLCFYDEVRDTELLARYHALMSEPERARQRRFYFERDQHQFLLTRALVRSTLSRYAPVEPAAWEFAANEHGRPRIVPDREALSFNLSNTSGLVACAVARHPELGVDVEHTGRKTEPMNIAARFFSDAEVAALRRLPAARHRERFFAYWTLKESYIKARGKGLAIPLGHFSFHLDEGPIRMSCAAELDDTGAGWRFALIEASADHYVALALRAPSARISVARCVPLADDRRYCTP